MQIASPKNGITNTCKIKEGDYLTKFRLNTLWMYQGEQSVLCWDVLSQWNDDSDVTQGFQHLRTDNNKHTVPVSSVVFQNIWHIFMLTLSKFYTSEQV